MKNSSLDARVNKKIIIITLSEKFRQSETRNGIQIFKRKSSFKVCQSNTQNAIENIS
jgi:hypothetical protein